MLKSQFKKGLKFGKKVILSKIIGNILIEYGGKSMKKFLSVAIALCLAASLVACGGSGDTERLRQTKGIQIHILR